MIGDQSRKQVLVELVDATGKGIGTSEKLAAHRPPGKLHRAFSVFLFDADGQLLLQRRAMTKYHSPGVWSNSCCGHPLPGEAPAISISRRVEEELGVTPSDLVPAGTITYRLCDPLSGLVEHEYNHTFLGRIFESPKPDPDEVLSTRKVRPEELADLLAREQFSVWFPLVAQAALTESATRLAGLSGWSWPAAAAAAAAADRLAPIGNLH